LPLLNINSIKLLEPDYIPSVRKYNFAFCRVFVDSNSSALSGPPPDRQPLQKDLISRPRHSKAESDRPEVVPEQPLLDQTGNGRR
jgi:hypothetical protein